MKFAKMPEEPELSSVPVIEAAEPELESAATPPSSSPASEDNETDRAEKLSQLQQQVSVVQQHIFSSWLSLCALWLIEKQHLILKVSNGPIIVDLLVVYFNIIIAHPLCKSIISKLQSANSRKL